MTTPAAPTTEPTDLRPDGRDHRPVTGAPHDILSAARHVARIASAAAMGHDSATTFPAEAFDEIRASGLLAAPLPASQGGAGFDESVDGRLLLLRLLTTIGRGDLSTGRIYEGHVNALQLMRAFGSPGQIERWAADARDHGMLFAVWNTEAGDGLRLIPFDDGRRLEGSKTFASGADHVSRPIVTAALPDGSRQMLVVPMERIDVTVDRDWWQPLGMRSSVSHRVDFTGVVVDPDDLLGAPGDYHRQPWLGAGAIRFAAVQLGGAQALLDATRDVLRALDRAGDAHQQTRMGHGALLVESGRLWLRGAAERVRLGPDAGQCDPSGRSIAYANLMRTAIERICLNVIEIAIRSAGARVLIQPHTIERIARDLTVYLRQPAPDAALAQAGAFTLESDKPIESVWNDDGHAGRASPTA
ncbi:MAG TPA: acyl-CoA dehydrogenase family protein [Thermomicrobiales bacterium]|nr:acyl-CoA dehydrogenase family protein [Thermomicrobiales bacterium]